MFLLRVFWPVVHTDTRFFKFCLDCQLVAPRKTPVAPLIPMPVVEVIFNQVTVDIRGPIEKSVKVYQYILVLLDYVIRYPEAVPI